MGRYYNQGLRQMALSADNAYHQLAVKTYIHRDVRTAEKESCDYSKNYANTHTSYINCEECACSKKAVRHW